MCTRREHVLENVKKFIINNKETADCSTGQLYVFQRSVLKSTNKKKYLQRRKQQIRSCPNKTGQGGKIKMIRPGYAILKIYTSFVFIGPPCRQTISEIYKSCTPPIRFCLRIWQIFNVMFENWKLNAIYSILQSDKYLSFFTKQLTGNFTSSQTFNDTHKHRFTDEETK